MTSPRIKLLLNRVRRIPLMSRIDWKLYLFRDLWSTMIWKRTKSSVTTFGFKLTTRVHPAYELMHAGKFEPDETRIFLHLMNSVDVFVDVGANIGYYCCLALQQHKAVIAIEPQPQNLHCLYQNLTSNGWENQAEVYPVALSSAPGLLSLYGASGPSASLVQHWAGYSSRFKQIVPTNTFDNVVAGRFPGKRLMIKIDVEGAEFQVLEGALATVARQPRPIWLIEVCFREYHPSGINPDYLKIFQLFWDNGYASYGADEKCTAVLPADIERWLATGVRDLQTFNYVFIDRSASLSTLLNQR